MKLWYSNMWEVRKCSNVNCENMGGKWERIYDMGKCEENVRKMWVCEYNWGKHWICEYGNMITNAYGNMWKRECAKMLTCLNFLNMWKCEFVKLWECEYVNCVYNDIHIFTFSYTMWTFKYAKMWTYQHENFVKIWMCMRM